MPTPDLPDPAPDSDQPDSHRPILCRGVRGATTADANTAESILTATRELLEDLIATNRILPDDVAAIWFTTTPDLTAEYPALAARQMGWHDSALMCGHEMAVPTGLKACIRVLILWNTTRSLTDIQHVYIRGAVHLRPDRSRSDQPFSGGPATVSPTVPVPSPDLNVFR